MYLNLHPIGGYHYLLEDTDFLALDRDVVPAGSKPNDFNSFISLASMPSSGSYTSLQCFMFYFSFQYIKSLFNNTLIEIQHTPFCVPNSAHRFVEYHRPWAKGLHSHDLELGSVSIDTSSQLIHAV